MMADLVRDHIGAREITGCVEAPLHLLEEVEIEIDPSITRTIERPHRRGCGATTRLGAAVKEHQSRRRVTLAASLEHLAPDVLSAAEHLLDELRLLIVAGRRDLLLLRRLTATAARDVADKLQDLGWILAEQKTDDDNNNDAAEAKPTAAERRTAATAATLPFNDVVAGSSLLPKHTFLRPCVSEIPDGVDTTLPAACLARGLKQATHMRPHQVQQCSH